MSDQTNTNGATETETGNRATRRAARSSKPAPTKSAKTRRAKAGRSSTPAVVVKTKPAPSEEELEISRLTKNILFKRSEISALDSKAASANIQKLSNSAGSTRKIAHITACGILLHYVEHGDHSKLAVLDAVIGARMSKAMQSGFRKWVEFFSTVRWDKDAKKYVSTVKGEGVGARAFNLDGDKTASEKTDSMRHHGALNHPFYSGSFGDTIHEYDFDKAFAAFAKRVLAEANRREELLKAKKKAEARRIHLNDSQLKAVTSLAKTLHITLESAAAEGNA